MNKKELEFMVRETTTMVLYFLNTNLEAREEALAIVAVADKKKDRERMLDYWATNIWSPEHDDTFGEIFEAELPLVNWRRIVKNL